MIRLTAMAVVAMRHLLDISGADSNPIPRCLGIGVFSALSGFLAMHSRGDSFVWLSRRLGRICLPYWICIALIFAANAAYGYKASPPSLVLAQFFGVALFTHPGQLVGVHTWFISLILLCYLMAAVIRKEPRLIPLFFVAALSLLPADAAVVGCALAFLAGATIAVVSRVWVACLGCFAASLILTRIQGTEFTYPLAGTVGLVVAKLLPGRRCARLSLASGLIYEFYLLHGPVYLGLARLLHVRFVSNLFLGTLIAVAGAWLLRSFSRKLGFLIGARFERLARPAVLRTSSLFLWPRALAPSGITRGSPEASS